MKFSQFNLPFKDLHITLCHGTWQNIICEHFWETYPSSTNLIIFAYSNNTIHWLSQWYYYNKNDIPGKCSRSLAVIDRISNLGQLKLQCIVYTVNSMRFILRLIWLSFPHYCHYFISVLTQIHELVTVIVVINNYFIRSDGLNKRRTDNTFYYRFNDFILCLVNL